MFKLLLLVTSFLSVFSADNNLRGRTLTTFLNEGDEWKQFANFQESVGNPLAGKSYTCCAN